ncbi:glycosyltransferase [Micromonospora endolithica]|uniref:Glycosyltransferase n=1 Tax=Micromonospora endolithica TaxID=230091 RepID=A0A3A9ZLG2_9ACTN|nr:glycosyltransferase [Micromonospora endolithica]TWJ23240.1 glycosyltransferase involved in cell wall biosynthesis [Micromonospora endolithica]
MVTAAPARVVAGLRRRVRRWSRRLRDATPRRLAPWQETVAAGPARSAADGAVELAATTVGELRRHLSTTGESTDRLRVVVREWETPYPGWSGRLGALPYLTGHQLTLPTQGRGRAEVSVVLARPLPVPRILAAVLAALRPDAPLPTPAAALLAVGGPPPPWLPARDAATAVRPDASTDGVRPYDLRLDRAGPAGPGTVGVAADPVGMTTADGVAVVAVDASAANPRGRRRPARGQPSGRLTVTAGADPTSWRIDRTPDEVTVVAGRLGEPLDDRQTRVLADLGAVTADGPGTAAAHEYAGLLAQLAMTGVPVHASALPPRTAALLGTELTALLTTAPVADLFAREIHGVRLRRAALRRHASAFALPGAVAGAYPSLARPPAVTALLLTRRPDRIVRAVADLAAQTYPELEIVVGLHGVELRPEVRAGLDSQSLPVHLVSLPAETGFGAALGEITRYARGSLVTKVDDDDRYGPEHVWDLVLARHYSGATLVGKGAEFVHLEAPDLTVRRQMASEIFTDVVAGGTMLLGRGDLEAVGGWRPVPRSVDRALLDRVLGAGGLVYRTHGFGFVYTRHADGHTWDPGQDYFLRNPLRRWDGLLRHEEFGTR